MHSKKIQKLKMELNKKIDEGADFAVIYDISVELDKLIVEYYKKSEEEAK